MDYRIDDPQAHAVWLGSFERSRQWMEAGGWGQVVPDLLPTPQTRDGKGPPGKGSQARGGHQSSLPAAIALLPTPGSTDWKGGNAPAGRVRADGRRRQAGDADLPEAVQEIMSWQEP